MSGRVREFGRVAGFGRVERPGLARAGLRGDAGPVVFEKDPGSVACPGFIPPTVVPEAVKVRRLWMGGPSQFPPLKEANFVTAGSGNTHCVPASGSRIAASRRGQETEESVESWV